MNHSILSVALRQQAIYVPSDKKIAVTEESKASTFALVAELSRLGYSVSEDLLLALHATPQPVKTQILLTFREVMGVHKNWTPLVKGWDVPTGESLIDHIITWYANTFNKLAGTTLACGHLIPAHTFPLERYNGCPYCGTPFEFGKLTLHNQGSRKKLLTLWTDAEANTFLADLLSSQTALDATQVESLKTLLLHLPVPEVEVKMKETLMVLIDHYVTTLQGEKAQVFFESPADILRYLWYKKTGFLQVIEPKTIIRRAAQNQGHFHPLLNKSKGEAVKKKEELKLKYSRSESKIVANWLNKLAMPAEKACEIMHPKRGMWVRMIRALRLAEYSHYKGFENLKRLLDVFYKQEYEVIAGKVQHFRLRSDAEKTMALLKQRPGLFARSLFSNILWFGPDAVIPAFRQVIDQVPARLVFTLNMYAQNYFDPNNSRAVKPLGGNTKNIPAHPLLSIYKREELDYILDEIEKLCLLAMEKRFAAVPNENKSMYIHPALFKIPVSIGDRTENVQDMPAALMGATFPVQGNRVRLFMQWGTGLPAQHLDMDLSCYINYHNGRNEFCSFSNLVAKGCKHSGDIRSIPNQVGTAEYIEIEVDTLRKFGAKYVIFTCNAYSNGALSPNMVVGWMSSEHKMKISESSGVAYDPSCVQHQVRITQPLTKGLAFGVLKVETAEIVWLEMPFFGQVVQQIQSGAIESLLRKLESKLSIGDLLSIKAKAQGLALSDASDADEVYSDEWARNTAAVTKLLID